MLDLGLVLVVGITSAVVYWFFIAIRHPKNFPPGPRYKALPMIGDAFSLGSNVMIGMEKLPERYGPICGLWLGPLRVVVIADFDLMNEACGRQEFSGRPMVRAAAYLRESVVKDSVPGILLASGKNWSEQRRFTLHNLKDFGFGKQAMEGLILDEVKSLCSNIKERKEQPVIVKNEFQIAILNALWRIVTGECFSYDDPKLKKLLKLLDQMLQEDSNLLEQLAVVYDVVAYTVDKLDLLYTFVALKQMFAFIKDTIQDHELTYQEGCVRDFIDVYLKEIRRATENDENNSFAGEVGKNNLANVILDLFLAGSETTTTTLNWGMLFMVLNPDVQEKVQQELDSVISGSNLLTMDDRSKTPYTEAVIQEILRLGNIANVGVAHRTTANCYLRNYYFPKDTEVFFNATSVMMDPRYFPEPHKFNPMRYLNEQGDFVPHPRVITFGLGKRRCLGETLAKMELYLFFAGILSQFKVVRARDSDILTADRVVTRISSPKPYEVKFIARDR